MPIRTVLHFMSRPVIIHLVFSVLMRVKNLRQVYMMGIFISPIGQEKVLPPKQVVQMMYSMKTLKPLIYVLLLSDIIVVIVVSVLIRFL